MHPILAENINGWLFAAAVFFGGLITSALALCALVPARQRNRRLTFALAAPALVFALLITLWTGYEFITEGLQDPDYSMRDFAIPWLVMAGPSVVTGLLAIAVFGLSTRRSTDA
jgi:hypothetical protein